MNAPSPQPWQVVHRPADAVVIAQPQAPCRIVYSLPHSGRYYPDSFIASARATGAALRASEDAFVDEMVSPQALGVHGVTGRYARAFCDVNRHPLELDARLIRGKLPRAALSLSARVRAGYGVIARRLSADQEIYRQPLDMDEVNLRLDLIHRPYHEALLGCLLAARAAAQPVILPVILIDWHSMPSLALSHLGAREARPDIVLGNRYGEGCGEPLVRQVKGFLEGRGLRVGLNKPFAGGYIVEHYGRPAAGVEALQIEINRAIYMDEAALQPHQGAERLKAIFADLTALLLSS